MKQDKGITELVGFILILTLVISLIAVVTALYLPLYLEEVEESQNSEALFAFSSLNKDITTICLAEEMGIQRKNTLPAAKLHQKVRLSLSYGQPVSHGSTEYRHIIVTYETENSILSDLQLKLSSSEVQKNGVRIAPSLNLVTDPDDTAEQMESDAGKFRVEYTYQGSFRQSGETYYILSVRLT